jgi:hypothetical protein
MKLNRVFVGAVAGVLGLAAGMAYRLLLPGAGPETSSRGAAILGLAVAGAVFWLAERLDLLASAYSKPIVDLYAKDDGVPPARQGGSRDAR